MNGYEMVSRKDQIKNLFVPTEEIDGAVVENTASDTSPSRRISGAVKAMGLSLSGLAREVNDARALQTALNEGEHVVELDTNNIDPSPFSDRLSDGAENDVEFKELVESMRESGQQVPILVRPLDYNPQHFEIAYGHRRVKAAKLLGIRVKAIIRPMSDAELVLAQGQENSQRRNLSFIEKALFAKSLVDAGVDRAVVQKALSSHKAEMTRYLSIAEMIPLYVARAIGPAPKIGRPRWASLAELMQKPDSDRKVSDVLRGNAFTYANSDERFALVYKRLSMYEPKRPKPSPFDKTPILSQEDAHWGGVNITIIQREKGTQFVVEDEKFAAFLKSNLESLAQNFEKQESNHNNEGL